MADGYNNIIVLSPSILNYIFENNAVLIVLVVIKWGRSMEGCDRTTYINITHLWTV